MKACLLLLAICFVSITNAQLPTMVQDIGPGTYNGLPNSIVLFNGALHFYANDSVHGSEIWKYNELLPASMINDVTPGTGSTKSPNYQGGLTCVFNNKLYFAGMLAGRNTLFVYDGTNTPVEAPGLSSFTSVGGIMYACTAGRKLYFTSQYAAGTDKQGLYAYNGVNPPVMVNIPAAGSGTTGGYNLIEYNGSLFFAAYSAAYGNQILYKLNPATNSYAPLVTSSFANGFDNFSGGSVINGKLYFAADADTAFREMYSYDGTTAKRLTNTFPCDNTRGLGGKPVLHNGYLYYSGSHSINTFSHQLHKCDPHTGGDVVADTLSI